MIMNMNGGGATMNFRIVGGTTAPANPQENTIWINTANTVTSWALAFSEPSNPVEGMVWVTINVSGRNTFNALKNNMLAVAPMSAKQYVSGAWKSREGRIYVDHAWKEFVLHLIKNGEEVYPLKLVGKSYNAQNPGSWSSYVCDPGDGFVTVGGGTNGYGIVYIEDIDLTSLKKLTIEGTFIAPDSKYKLMAWSELGTYITDNVARSASLPNGTGTLSMDVSSLTGVYTVGFSSVSTNKQKITNFWAE